ncbi:MAG: TVP38/TMEM64 family protein [Tatlockia sp.]|nr:TVP38/TMEM64 family protein [Tatlockia sp.]
MRTLWIALTIIAFIASTIIFQEKAPLILLKIKALGWFAPSIFLVIYCLASILFLPTMVLTLAGGALFGPLWGTLFNLIGATLGAASAFCISRHFVGDWLALHNKAKFNQLIAGVERRGWQFVALLRLIPIVPGNLVNYGLGLTRIKFSHFLITSFIFLIPAEIIYSYCGYVGMDVFANPLSYYKNAFLVAMAALALVMSYKFLSCYRNFSVKTSDTDSDR